MMYVSDIRQAGLFPLRKIFHISPLAKETGLIGKKQHHNSHILSVNLQLVMFIRKQKILILK